MTRLRNPYLWLVSALGVLLIAWSAAAIPGLDRLDQLVLIALLAIAAQGTITFTDSGGYISVGSAISLSTVPLYGPAAAVLIAAIAEITPWFIMIRRKPGTWHDALEHLLFNVGMSTLAAYLASLTFLAVQGFFPPDSVQALLAPWLPAALVGDQVNFWFLVGILYLANGASPRETWRAHRWAIPLNLTLTTLGGGMLAVAAQQFGTLGILIFFLPIILSAYAFRLYVNKTREQMDRLEELVNQRTGELAQANEEMRELYEQKDAFLSVLTHDMRSPLTSIHGFATMLRDRPELPPEKRTRMADIIVRSERALLEIVNNILDIEKMESGSELLLERDQFDIHDLLREVAELSLAQAYEKEHQAAPGTGAGAHLSPGGPAEDPARDAEPALQCPEIHARQRRRLRLGARQWALRPDRRSRHRLWHSRGRSAVRF